MVRMKAHPDSLLMLLTRKVGMFKAVKVLVFIACWGTVSEDLGRPPESVEEYAHWWKTSVPTAYREQRLFREALPKEDTPTRIWEALRDEIDARQRKNEDTTAAALGLLALPA